MEGDTITMQEIFVFERKGVADNGAVRGVFRSTGIRPKFAERMLAAGYRLRPGLFESAVGV
jgi:pilus assembly protein CpaF